MSKKIPLLLIVMIATISVKAQIGLATRDSTRKNIDILIKGVDTLSQRYKKEHEAFTKKGFLRQKTYNKFIENRFTYLTYQRGAFPVGNSASLDVLEDATQLRLGLARKWVDKNEKPTVIGSLGLQAKLGSGISNLFSGNIPSTGMTITGNLSFLLRQKHFKNGLTEFLNGKEVPSAFSKLLNKAKKLKDDFEEVNQRRFIESKILLCRLDKISHALDTLGQDCNQYAALVLERNKIEAQLNDLNLFDGTTTGILDNIEKNYEDAYYNLYMKNPVWDYFKIRWFDLGISYNRSTYATYDGNLLLSKRFDSKNFDEVGVKVAYNYFKERSKEIGLFRAIYTNLSYQPKITNNYADMSDISITSEIQVGASGDTTHTFVENKLARNITNVAFKTSWAHAFSGTFTGMFGDEKNVGINLFLQAQYSKISKPIYNSKFGVIFNVVNNNFAPEDKESKAKISFELFLQFNDLNNVAESKKSVWQRRVIGLSTNIPFSKILLN